MYKSQFHKIDPYDSFVVQGHIYIYIYIYIYMYIQVHLKKLECREKVNFL